MTLVQRRRALQDLGFDVGDKRRPLPSAKFIDYVFVEALAKHDAVGMLCDCLACGAANWFRLNLIGVFSPRKMVTIGLVAFSLRGELARHCGKCYRQPRDAPYHRSQLPIWDGTTPQTARKSYLSFFAYSKRSMQS